MSNKVGNWRSISAVWDQMIRRYLFRPIIWRPSWSCFQFNILCFIDIWNLTNIIALAMPLDGVRGPWEGVHMTFKPGCVSNADQFLTGYFDKPSDQMRNDQSDTNQWRLTKYKTNDQQLSKLNYTQARWGQKNNKKTVLFSFWGCY